MKDFEGKVAFITGGGSGVGLGQATVFGRAGTKIVIADIRRDHLDEGLRQLSAEGIDAHAIELDISDREAYAAAADEVERIYGTVQLLFNTAGVSIFGPLEKSTYDDYDWQIDVNQYGVINGIQTFLPRMIEYGKGGHIVTTASLGAFTSAGPAGIYCMTKFAVRGLCEALRPEVEKYGIGVTILCPANVNTNIAEATKTRPAKYAKSGYKMNEEILGSLRRIYSQGKDPVELAEATRLAVEENRLYCIPYPEARQPLEAAFQAVLDSLPPEDSDPEGVAKRHAAMVQYRKELEEMQYGKKSD